MPVPDLRKYLFARRGLIYSLLLSLFILGLGGLGFWLLEPRVHDLGDGLWLAFTTAATVGYGDLVPSTDLSRVFAVVVVLMGLGVLSLVTASVAAIFVEQEERQIERDLLREIVALRREMAELQDEIAAMRRAPAGAPADSGHPDRIPAGAASDD